MLCNTARRKSRRPCLTHSGKPYWTARARQPFWQTPTGCLINWICYSCVGHLLRCAGRPRRQKERVTSGFSQALTIMFSIQSSNQMFVCYFLITFTRKITLFNYLFVARPACYFYEYNVMSKINCILWTWVVFVTSSYMAENYKIQQIFFISVCGSSLLFWELYCIIIFFAVQSNQVQLSECGKKKKKKTLLSNGVFIISLPDCSVLKSLLQTTKTGTISQHNRNRFPELLIVNWPGEWELKLCTIFISSSPTHRLTNRFIYACLHTVRYSEV